MMLHNNIGFNSNGSKDIATEITTNCGFWPPDCRLRPLAMEAPRISAWTLDCLNVESPWATFLPPLIVWAYLFFKFAWRALKDASFVP